MSASYREINYGLRAAKCIERKMLCEAFRRLSNFHSLDRYRYVGFGSTYFSDFVLIHKSLGITDMVSIEMDTMHMERFKFNKPYRCIKMEFGHSNARLPTLSWDIPSIVWLDYDGSLTREVLADVKFVTSSAIPGTSLTISVNAEPIRTRTGPGEGKPDEQRFSALQRAVGELKIPSHVTGDKLAKSGTARVSREIVLNEIAETLMERNAARDPKDHIRFEQVFNFHYSDGALMLTVGGVFYDEAHEVAFRQCDFGSLRFVRKEDAPYKIQAPNLTYREIRKLDSQLPAPDGDAPVIVGVPSEDIAAYVEVYRYFPAYTEAEL